MAWKRTAWRQRRSLQRVIAAVLAATPLQVGCSSTSGCGQPPVPFDIDKPVTASMMDELVATSAATQWSEVSCEQVCQRMMLFNSHSVSSCALALPTAVTAGGASSDGTLTCAGESVVICEGRRPLGHVELPVGHGFGATVAAMTHMELASISAFEELAVVLENLGASPVLIERCLEAADDERRHAALLAQVAAEHGVAVHTPSVADAPADLFSIALHNAVEGCVRESWAAYVAHERARRCEDPRLAGLFKLIAEDETRHGQLAWDLDDFFRGQLSDVEIAAVERAQRRALGDLPRLAASQASLPAALGAMPAAIGCAAARGFAEALQLAA